MKLDRRRFVALTLLQAAPPAAVKDDWQGVERVVAVGDVHGDKDAFVAVLRMAGLVDGSGRWTGGRTHLVQIGDIPSRGPQSRQCYDYLMRLGPEAEQAGGRLHALIGNHDAGVIYGDRRNVLPEEYAEFRSPEALALLESAWKEEMEARRRANRLPADAAEVEALRAAWFESHPPGFVEHTRAFGPKGPYGQWIRGNNAVIRINDTLFHHAGISPKYATRTRSSLNATIRRELSDPDRLIPGLTSDVLGPLWYRGFAEEEEPALEAHLRAVLRFHGVKRVVFGHTVTRTAILPRFQARAINIDLGLSRFFGRPPACLVLEKSEVAVLHRGTRIPVTPDVNAYLQAVLAADGPDSPVKKLLP